MYIRIESAGSSSLSDQLLAHIHVGYYCACSNSSLNLVSFAEESIKASRLNPQNINFGLRISNLLEWTPEN